ncbi:hypothetical protein FSP39_017081 [Pinctada imbricata]|uniref:Rab9 effector protein with kelch motifs n=1 Tax=Pinctada imbricata TaxID=66713 RepID=A0AA88XMR8_PINIB|nr:hypothetical protein FSP39_017081 [Pinctada imbricata]
MELHPILEKDTLPNTGLWYVMSTLGDCPSIRVGHTCTYIKGATSDNQGKLYVIGGANPSGAFCDTFVLDLATMMWDIVDFPGFRARYEHTAFCPKSQPDKIYVFGGADTTGNMNDIQVLDTNSNSWSSPTITGSPPSPRTFHGCAVVGDKFIVYSGGNSGPDPVGDRQVHCLDITTLAWSILPIKGDSPKPRHGHIMVAVGNRLYIHGGMAGSAFYDDLHIMDLDKNSWSNVRKKKVYPSARAAHSGASLGTNIYIFGGMNREGALDDMYKFDTLTNLWTKIELQGPPPPSRLDFGMCVVELTQSLAIDQTPEEDIVTHAQQAKEILDRELKPGSASSRDSRQDTGSESSSVTYEIPQPETDEDEEETPRAEGATAAASAPSVGKKMTFALVHGGMDTEGEIFDDSLVYLLE